MNAALIPSSEGVERWDRASVWITKKFRRRHRTGSMVVPNLRRGAEKAWSACLFLSDSQ